MKRIPVLLLGLLLLAAPAAARLIGEPVAFSGSVRTPAGEPLPGLTVVLELRREAFRLSKLKKTTSIPVRMVTTTDESGRWSLDWAWDGHYNRFALVWGIASPDPDRDLAALQSRDVTDTVLAAEPVVADLTLETTPWSQWVVDYLRGRASADEKEVFAEMGAPDRIEVLSTPGGGEDTWFYFEAGRAYRFAEGRLLGVESFAPVGAPAPAP